LARKIGESTYLVTPGIIVQPIFGANEERDGWQIIVKGEYVNDYPTKRQAVEAAMTLVPAGQ
jgi:hypothetical protein